MTTPNGVSLGKRIGILMGSNPYDLISEDINVPLHFREYTMNELAQYSSQAGFSVQESFFADCVDHRFASWTRPSNQPWQSLFKNRLARHALQLTYRLVPGALKPCLCFVLRAGTMDEEISGHPT